MALGTNHVDVTAIDSTSSEPGFIPELWSDDTIAAYKANLVVAGLVTRMNHKGKKGDTIYIPSPNRGSASTKAEDTQVTLIAAAGSTISVSINKHYEYSRLFEDVADMQALNSMRRFYADDAGFALATRIDRELFKLAGTFQGGNTTQATSYEGAVIGSDGTTSFDNSANTNTGNGATLSDEGIRKMIQTLDDADVPMDGRKIVIPPVERNNLMGLARFTEQAFVGNGETIQNGRIGNLYGVEVFVSSACPWLHVNDTDSGASVTFSSTSPTGASFSDEYGQTADWSTSTPTDTKYRAGLMFHKDAMVLVEQSGVRTQQQYKQEYLGTLVTTDGLFGVGELRDNGAVAFVVPA
ncbi:MAG: phage capsid protein [Candidatus Thorarchaeota archaeon]|jgi:hypothetical protein